MFSSPLTRAIKLGMKPGGDLAGELRALDDYTVRSKKDAKAICGALAALSLDRSSGKSHSSSALRALTSLFQDVDGRDAPAFDVLSNEGLPQLIRIFDSMSQSRNEDDVDALLFLLNILALYGTREGAQKVVEAARLPLKPEAYMWHVILSVFSGGHPQRDFVFLALSDPPPPGLIAVGLLESANNAAFGGTLPQHPFDTRVGWNQLHNWLVDSDPEHASYAHSATAALPFLSNPVRDQLLALAMEHVNTDVQMEAAWAAAKLGREAGLKILARFCLDVNHSETAQRYLEELKREDLIPIEAKDASFQAKAEFANWLAHPNELGRPPDELEIVDHRQLLWPPDYESKPFWWIQYRVRDRTGLEDGEVGCGLVGSATWCFFSDKTHERPPEDAYGIHCYWEMQHAKLIEENEVTDASEYAGLLCQWPGEPLESAEVLRVAEVSPKLKIPSRFVALAAAVKDGQKGWVVLDGPRRTWYPEDEQPNDTSGSSILRIHIGRELLGFQDPPNRKKYLGVAAPSRSPQQFITAYEMLLSEVPGSDPKRQKELLGSDSCLARHFDHYVNALVESEGSDKTDTIIRVYSRFLELAAQSDESIREDAYCSGSLLGCIFETYVDALMSRSRSEEVAGLIEIFSPRWDYPLSFVKLGRAAFKAGQREIAEKFFLKLRESWESHDRFEEMGMLAQIWNDRGDVKAASELLVDCLRKLVTRIKYNPDFSMYVEEFEHHRSTYLRLFPNGEKELADLGIPAEAI